MIWTRTYHSLDSDNEWHFTTSTLMSECPSAHTNTKAQLVFIVQVNNSYSLYKMTIQLSDTIVDVCNNTADILQCYCTTVVLDYTTL